MNIVWMSWKDLQHPDRGGAEVVSGEIMKRLVKDGHSVTLLTSSYEGSPQSLTDGSGIHVVHLGNRYTVYWRVYRYYQSHLAKNTDIIIDEMNTIPFYTGLYRDRTKAILLAHQLAREVWFYQMPKPLSWIGYLLVEPFSLRLLSNKYSKQVVVSESTKTDLAHFGFKNTTVFRVGMDLKPLEKLPSKERSGKLLSLGAIRPMKRTLDIIKAFELARDTNTGITLDIAGDDSGKYGSTVRSYILTSRHRNAITLHGQVSYSKKINLMSEADAILVASVKEGWGLIVTEANSQGTPAIGYDIDGYRDSIRQGSTGILTKQQNTPEHLAEAILHLYSLSSKDYQEMCVNGWQYSKQFNFDDSYASFLAATRLLMH